MSPALISFMIRGFGALAIGLAIFATYRHISGAFAERDQLRVDKKVLEANYAALGRAIKTSEQNTKDCEKDAQNVADLASRYIKDKQDVDIALADALASTQRVRVITRHTVGSSHLPSAASADATGDHGACEAGLPRADEAGLDERVSRVRDETYRVAAEADKVTLRLTLAQERIGYLEQTCHGETRP